MKRALCMLLVLVMLASSLPLTVFAAEIETQPAIAETTEVTQAAEETAVSTEAMEETTAATELAVEETTEATEATEETEEVTESTIPVTEETVPATEETEAPTEETIPVTEETEAPTVETIPDETEEEISVAEDNITAPAMMSVAFVKPTPKTITTTETIKVVKEVAPGNYTFQNKTVTREHQLPWESVMPQNSEPVSAASIEKQSDNFYTFSTLEDLKELAGGSYSNFTTASYSGSEPLVISEDLTLPNNLALYSWNQEVIVNSGCVFTLNDSAGFHSLVVNGTIHLNWFYVEENLTVNGVLYAYQSFEIYDGATVSGLDRVVFPNSSTQIIFSIGAETMSDLNAAVATAKAATNSRYCYQIDLANNFVISNSITLPENCYIVTYNATSVTINSGCTLAVTGYTTSFTCPVTIKGTLKNDGQITLLTSNATLSFTGSGTYAGSGRIIIYENSTTDPASMISGLDIRYFEIKEYNDYSHYWQLRYIKGLTKLATPTNLKWGTYYDHYVWDAASNQYIVEDTPMPGAISFNPIATNAYMTNVRYYTSSGENAMGGTSAFGWWWDSNSQIPDRLSHSWFGVMDMDSGTYYFTVTNEGDYVNTYNSDAAKSASWTYTKPSSKLAKCTNLSWNGKTIRFAAPSTTAYVGGYEVEIYFSAIEGVTPKLVGSTWNYDGADSKTVYIDWAFNQYGTGYYAFRIRALSSNITKYCNSDWSALSDITYINTNPDVPAKPYKAANVVSGSHVYWKAVDGAVKYGLWRSETGKNGTYKWISNPTVPHFTDTTVKSGKTYYYKVTAMDAQGNHTDKSEAIGITYVATPDISKRTNVAAGVQLEWQKIEGVTGYAIYRKSYDGDDAWDRIGTIPGNETFTWTDASVKNKNGEIYRYTIRALAGSDMKTLSGCRNTGRTMVRLSSQVLKSAVKASSTSIKCTWTTSSRVTGYEVRFMVDGEVYKTYTVGNYKTGVKTFTGLKAGNTYTIQVRTYKKVDGVGSFYSDWSTAKTVKL